MPPTKKPGAGGQSGVVEAQSEINGGNLGEEFVSLGTVKEMLKVQESMLRTLFDSVVNSLNARIDDVLSSVSSIKASLEYSQKEIEDLKPLEAKLDQAYETVHKIVSDIKAQQLKTEYLENHSKRNNIRVNGIEESVKETWQDSEEKVKMAVREKLGMDITIERAHRVEKRGGKARKKGPRTIVCRLRDWKQREEVLRKARREKPEGLFISEDLAFETLQKREPLVPKLKAAKAEA
ncbi:uncharacterized protein [Montipora foliosa]|uniref:uncharacterized protein n=1 Tax=Montipora foliosa TaxID=591990 RepID=UPI0035F14377